MSKLGSLVAVLLIALQFVSPNLMAIDAYDPTSDLVNAFGSNCSSYGDQTALALSQSQVLKDVISSIKSDPACKGISTDALDSDIQSDLALKSQAHQDKLPISQLQKMNQDLAAAVQVEQSKAVPDPVYIETLQTNIYNNQLSILQAQQKSAANGPQMSMNRISAISNHGMALMDAIGANSACMTAHPNVVGQIGAQVLKLSSEWASSLAGTALLAAGSLVDHFIQLINSYGVNHKLKVITDSRLKFALGCTFEGLTSTYCRSRDLELVQKANLQAQQFAGACGTVGEGTNLLSRDLPAFQDFVSTIYAGSPANSSATAGEKTGVAYLEAGLKALRYSFQGHTANYEKNYDNSTIQADKDNAVRIMIRTLSADVKGQMNAQVTTPGGVNIISTGPVGDNFPDSNCGPITYYYTNGSSKACAPDPTKDASATNPCESCIAHTFFNQAAGTFPPLPTIAEVRKTSALILDLGGKYVVQQQQIYKQNNPQSALSASEFLGKNQRLAKEFLNNAQAYLKHILNDPDGVATGHMRKTIQASLSRIKSVLDILEKSANDPNASAADTVSVLSDLVAPESDQAYIPTELQMIVSQDINMKMRQGKISKNLAMVLQLSTSDSLSELLNSYGSLEALRNQMRSSREMTKKNLSAFGGLFSSQIELMLKDMKKEVDADPRNEDLRDNLRLFCIQTLLVPDAPKVDGRDLTPYCKGEEYFSLYVKSGLKLKYDDLSKQKFSERACSLYDFYRKSRLYGIGVGNAR